MSASLRESCSCGAEISVSERASSVLGGYQLRDFRIAHTICRQPVLGRCGEASKHPSAGDTYKSFCALPHGHDGWHRDDQGMEWTLKTEGAE